MFPHNLNIIYDDIVQSDKNACQKSRETKETTWKHPVGCVATSKSVLLQIL